MKNYFKELENRFRQSYQLAQEARDQGLDPSKEVEVLPANDLAERVENLIGIDGLSDLITEMEQKGYDREKICLKITDALIKGKLGHIGGKQKIAEKAVRTSVALLTEGIVAAPIEGISEVKVEGEDNYLRISYSGPIRSAGGTAQVVSVLVGDYVRRKLNIGRFEATDNEIERYQEEIPLYKKIKNLQYTPTKKEINEIIANCPILVDGESTEDEEVSGQRNLERIKTNRVRRGMCLVVAEGLALKAPKLKRLVNDLDIGGWSWLDNLIKEEEEEDSTNDDKNAKYLSDLIAGRPVFSHPSRAGGFRLRYGRSRNSGLATAGISPASMIVLERFLSSGTQIKFEKPGKAAGIVSVDTIEGPTVKLQNGDVIRVNQEEKAKKIKDEVKEILDAGEILINFGDFLENNHNLSQPSFTEEWWKLLAKQKNTTPSVSSAKEAIKKSKNHDIPLHPKYTFLWHDLRAIEIKKLRKTILNKGEYHKKLVIPNKAQIKEILEKLLVEHEIKDEKIILDEDNSLTIIKSLGLDENLDKKTVSDKNNSMELINDLASFKIKKRSPTRIGCRMGRPEKSKERKMSPPTHLLFPLGEAGGKERSVEKATSEFEINVKMGKRKCLECETETYKPFCPNCNSHTELIKECPNCNIVADEKCPKCSRDTTAIQEFNLSLSEEYKQALEDLNERNNYDKLKGVKGLTSKNKTPEPLEKGILRAKHDQYVFKDGTIRYDLTDLPLTHFKPKEINTSIEELRKLGYKEDIKGNDLKTKNQILELKPQDVILSEEACNYLLNTTKFIDDLLEKYYGLKPYYNAEKIEDLRGILLVGLAPHTSSGVLSRLIGTTKAQANYAHPYFHAAKRRNCLPGDYEVKLADGTSRTLKEIFDSAENPTKADSTGTIEKDIELEVKTIEKDKITTSKASKTIKTPAKEFKIEFETESGRKIETFPDHRMKTASGVKRAKRVEKEDELLTPAKTEIKYGNQKDKKKIDIPEKSDPKLTTKKGDKSLLSKIEVGPDLMALLGYYNAKGNIQKLEKENKSVFQVCFGFENKKVREDIIKRIKSVFWEKPSEENQILKLNSRLIYKFFKKIGSEETENKRVPDLVKKSSKEKIKKYLSAYFTANGFIEKNPLTINVISSSRKFLNDIDSLLNRFNIYSKYDTKTEEKDYELYSFNKSGNPKIRLHELFISSSNAMIFGKEIGFMYREKQSIIEDNFDEKKFLNHPQSKDNEVVREEIISKRIRKASEKFMYDIEVNQTHNFITHDNLVTNNCDGDEDCYMLLLDGLLNFSRRYVPDKTGGRMDAPLVLTYSLDPKEVDDEAHNLDIGDYYSLDFYKAAEKNLNPKEVDVEIGENRLETDHSLDEFGYTIETDEIAGGPKESSYKTLGPMIDKTKSQLDLAKKIKAVDEDDVAERIIQTHFLPDLMGNLRAFSTQRVRCVKCNSKYRRPPLKGKCLNCGGALTLTVHENSVKKYLEISKEVAEKYDVSDYVRERLNLLEISMESLFENDLYQQKGLSDFM